MHRTHLFLATAAALGLIALLAGPLAHSTPTPLHPDPGPVPIPGATGGSLSLTGRLSHPLIPSGQTDVFVTAEVQGKKVPGAHRSPVDLAVVIDRSGSMAGDKLAYAKRAAEALVGQLTEQDRLAIIHYGSDVRTFPSRAADPAGREAMIAFIRSIRDDGGTNIGAALGAARAQLAGSESGIRRIILISDGQPTEGITRSSQLAHLALEIHRAGISVSAIGVGTDFNEDLMQAIADNGSGSYGYLQNTRKLASLFERDLQQASTMVARDVELSFKLPSNVTLDEVVGRSFTRDGDRVRVMLPDISSGASQRVVAHLIVTAQEAGTKVEVTDLQLRYRDLIADREGQAEVALSSQVSNDRQEVMARRDKKVAVEAARAQTAENLEKAAVAVKAGEAKRARALLDRNLAILHRADEVAGPAAVARDFEVQQQAAQGLLAAPTPERMEDAVKKAKSTARLQSGRANTYGAAF